MAKYEVELPKVLYLVFKISKFAKDNVYYNTTDLCELANSFKPELVRTREDKEDYLWLDDTKKGGLRGNLSTALTFKGLIWKNNSVTPYYGIGKKDTLFNAIHNGKIILADDKYIAYTNDLKLYELLLFESRNLSIRESQAHIKVFLKNNSIDLQRDSINFKKVAVVKTSNNVYFERILFNTFINRNVIEYNMYSYLKGKRIKTHNLHPLFAVPSTTNAWAKLFTFDSKYILERMPLFIYFDVGNERFFDAKGNEYPHYTFEEGKNILSGQNGNIDLRLDFDWINDRENLVEDVNVNVDDFELEEGFIFNLRFMKFSNSFEINGKHVVSYAVSSSGGADVLLQFSGGTKQKLELEHKWVNYINHKHYKNMAWKDTWLFADELWDFDLIKNIFSPYVSEYIDCIPKVFLCVNSDGEKEAYEVDWDTLTFTKLDIK